MDFLVCSDEDAGLVVPDSAVTIRHGTYGVFELVGDRLVFRSVTGKPIEDGRFLSPRGFLPEILLYLKRQMPKKRGCGYGRV